MKNKYWEQRTMIHESVSREMGKMMCAYFPFLNNDIQAVFEARDEAMEALNAEFNVAEVEDENLHNDEG